MKPLRRVTQRWLEPLASTCLAKLADLAYFIGCELSRKELLERGSLDLQNRSFVFYSFCSKRVSPLSLLTGSRVHLYDLLSARSEDRWHPNFTSKSTSTYPCLRQDYAYGDPKTTLPRLIHDVQLPGPENGDHWSPNLQFADPGGTHPGQGL